MDARGACLSHEGVDNKRGIAAQSKAAEQKILTDLKKANTQQGVAKANDPELPELDTDLEGSGELPGAQCWEA